jgi:hypothetical protein
MPVHVMALAAFAAHALAAHVHASAAVVIDHDNPAARSRGNGCGGLRGGSGRAGEPYGYAGDCETEAKGCCRLHKVPPVSVAYGGKPLSGGKGSVDKTCRADCPRCAESSRAGLAPGSILGDGHS